jgi:hypothetical protein
LNDKIDVRVDRLNELGVDRTSAKRSNSQQTLVNYVLSDRRVGEVAVDLENGVLFGSDLVDGVCFTPPQNIAASTQQNEEDASSSSGSDDESTGPPLQRNKKKRQLSKQKRKQMKRWVLDKKFGVWVPKRCIVIDKSKHTRREKLADGAERVRRWFLGSQNKFSKRAKRTITITTLAAVGASDFGVQSVIFGCLKALTDELRFGLTHKQLANACPSVKTLRNWEFQLAGGCLATVIDRINKDAKILIDRHKKSWRSLL